mgnify:CR=1 FL=1
MKITDIKIKKQKILEIRTGSQLYDMINFKISSRLFLYFY